MNNSYNKTKRVLSVAETIHQLPIEARQKVLTLVDLLLDVPAPASARAQRMIQDALSGERVSPDQCLVEIDCAIEYLLSERSIYKANDIVLSS